MKITDLSNFVMPPLLAGHCLTLSDIAKYSVNMSKDYQVRVVKCLVLDLRTKRFMANSDFVAASKLDNQLNSLIEELIKDIIN